MYKPPSIILQALCVPDLIPWIYLSLPLYNHKVFYLGNEWPSGFPYFLQFKSEFCNKDLSHSQFKSCFCWLYRASPSLAAKNIINLIPVLTIRWCPCVESSLVLLKEGVCKDRAFSWQNPVSLCPASCCTPRPNLPALLDISWLPSFVFQSPIMKRTSFFGY